MEKTRNLSKEEFLKNLQLEYFSHRLRTLIYDSPVFIKIHKEIAEKKKLKIIETSQKFHQISIFESSQKFEEFFKKIFLQEYGLPNLRYNPKNEKDLSYWDKFYLLKIGSIFIWQEKEYKVIENNPNEEIVSFMKGNFKSEIPYNYLKIKLLSTLDIDYLK